MDYLILFLKVCQIHSLLLLSTMMMSPHSKKLPIKRSREHIRRRKYTNNNKNRLLSKQLSRPAMLQLLQNLFLRKLNKIQKMLEVEEDLPLHLPKSLDRDTSMTAEVELAECNTLLIQ